MIRGSYVQCRVCRTCIVLLAHRPRFVSCRIVLCGACCMYCIVSLAVHIMSYRIVPYCIPPRGNTVRTTDRMHYCAGLAVNACIVLLAYHSRFISCRIILCGFAICRHSVLYHSRIVSCHIVSYRTVHQVVPYRHYARILLYFLGSY
jgi:hypothetical protein